MKAVFIKKVEIHSFRNLKDKVYDLNGSPVAFVGNNRLGKTNTLHAIAWCLTGYDLDNSKDMLSFVPFDYRGSDKFEAVSVSIELNVGTIKRVVDYVNGSCSQRVFVDNVYYDTQKEADALIDELLGLLTASINHRQIDIRRFLINPLYFTLIPKATFRSFVISLINNVDPVRVLDSLPKAIQEQIVEDLTTHDMSIAKVSKAYKTRVDILKGRKLALNTIIDYLDKNHKELESDIKLLRSELSAVVVELLNYDTKGAALDKFGFALAQAYDRSTSNLFGDVKVRVLEKGIGDDVWAEVCYPLTENGLPFVEGSTSERIILACEFVSAIRKNLNLPVMPFVFDECETLDKNSLSAMLDKFEEQLLVAKVVSGKELTKEDL